ncbi:LysR family transcriptional regulator [Achromobacter denitrificans]|uniref:LysR family transcriptional regulator n=1 Tax=Achromobacter TaxID=222 RepID=UPI0007879EA3|nr:LysR family transcriptional regulator [Achromobacter denitrificans]MDX3878795.1 LysR family transcriptional regulator [Achromobacter sp.]ASC65760.1 LysR family transcriptional regulator [Achromobacter denitrificans]MBV2158744.1 LysR family transcriptional regulator [Achromobacter denitrificans]MPT37475.1 LysR family transcriptional regulator [Achromobacter sp.]OLU08035.1 LysR family transcriptional regulator [Achromobacter denitrificans]
MDKHPEWNDLRVFLAVARLGTISDAGEKLGIEHSTVSRRIDRLEATLRVVLFDRRRSGYSLTDAGHALIPHAERMESALLAAVEESLEVADFIKGNVRVGTPEAFGIHVLAPGMAQLRQKHPGLRIELMAQPQFPSLVTREVEILVTLDPPEMGRYKVARLAQIDYFLYCSPGYRKSHPPIRELGDLAEHDFVDYIHDGSVSERYRVLEELVAEPKRCFTSNSVLAQRSAAAAGLGLVLLTPYVANIRSGDLISVFPDKPLITRSLWIAAPEDLLRIKRYQFAWRFIREQVESQPALFHPPA